MAKRILLIAVCEKYTTVMLVGMSQRIESILQHHHRLIRANTLPHGSKQPVSLRVYRIQLSDSPMMLAAKPSTITSVFFFFSSRRRHTRLQGDWSSDVCSSD